MHEVPFLRSSFNYDTDAASRESGLRCSDVTLAKQSFQEECDINVIVRRFGLTGQLPTGVRAPTYGDFSDVVDFHTAMNAVAQAGEAFDRMPAEIRARFHNSPQEFVEFCSQESNREEASKLGLVVPKAAELVSAPTRGVEVSTGVDIPSSLRVPEGPATNSIT